MKKIFNKKIFIFIAVFLGIALFAFWGIDLFFESPSFKYSVSSNIDNIEKEITEEEIFIPVHITVPDSVKGIYMTSCVAATSSWRKRMAELVDETELNSIIIDIKDYSGTISFNANDPLLKDNDAGGCVVSDMPEFVDYLHKKGIYVIGRITVFQDPYFAEKRPDLAVKKESDGSVWKDYKGISFIDANAKEFWDYIVALSKESYNIGFDELNFDYIRFPSDGNMKDIYYPFSEKRINEDIKLGKARIIRNFFAYLHEQMKNTGAVLSADLFGMVTTNTDDLNIGQILEYAEPYFDYIAPMVYPSHYPVGFNGYKNVNQYPYEIVKFSMDEAVKRLIAATSTPNKLRPWLQDFDYPVKYTADMVRKQKQAVYDAGLSSWMLWDPANKYTREALD